MFKYSCGFNVTVDGRSDPKNSVPQQGIKPWFRTICVRIITARPPKPPRTPDFCHTHPSNEKAWTHVFCTWRSDWPPNLTVGPIGHEI